MNKLVAAELAAMGPNTGANISALAFAPLKFKVTPPCLKRVHR